MDRLRDARLVVLSTRFTPTGQVLGVGTYGTVDVVEDAETGISFARKTLDGIRGTSDVIAEMRNAIATEALVWKDLRHPRVLPLLGVCFDPPAPFLIMPYMPNGTLVEFTQGHRDQMLRLLSEAASGLAYLHSHEIRHGDVKGNNFLVDEAGHACVCDFGGSRSLPASSTSMSVQRRGVVSPLALVPARALSAQGQGDARRRRVFFWHDHLRGG
jgi:serine/threonine protein kinase